MQHYSSSNSSRTQRVHPTSQLRHTPTKNPALWVKPTCSSEFPTYRRTCALAWLRPLHFLSPVQQEIGANEHVYSRTACTTSSGSACWNYIGCPHTRPVPPPERLLELSASTTEASSPRTRETEEKRLYSVRTVDAQDVQQKKKPSGLKRLPSGWDALHQIQQRNSKTSVFVVSKIRTDAQTHWAGLVAVLQCSSGMARMEGL